MLTIRDLLDGTIYTLTETGYSLKPILDAMVKWGTEYKKKNGWNFFSIEKEAKNPVRKWKGALGGGKAGRGKEAGRGGQLCKRLLHDGDETQKIVEALAEHDFSS